VPSVVPKLPGRTWSLASPGVNQQCEIESATGPHTAKPRLFPTRRFGVYQQHQPEGIMIYPI
jgi:hypothetical protein